MDTINCGVAVPIIPSNHYNSYSKIHALTPEKAIDMLRMPSEGVVTVVSNGYVVISVPINGGKDRRIPSVADQTKEQTNANNNNVDVEAVGLEISGLAIDHKAGSIGSIETSKGSTKIMKEKAEPAPGTYITFFNFSREPYGRPLACPPGRKFQRVLIQGKSIEIFRDQLFSGEEGSCTIELPLKEDSFHEIFQDSAMVIIRDSMFVQDFGGLKALIEYFHNAGTVLVHCVDGLYGIGKILSEKFGCHWKLQSIGTEKVEFTDRGKHLFGVAKNPSPLLLSEKVHWMRSPEGEALVSKKVYNLQEFKDAYEPDSDDEDAYSNYIKNEAGQHALCLYEGFGADGKLIWNGDRGQNPILKETFEKLLAL